MKMMITTEVVNISPVMAEKWLKKNMINRPISKSRVDSYAIDMKRGCWELNGEGIRFDEDGRLIDGQHRLSAIVKSNTVVTMVVTKGISKDVTLYDRGRNRSESDSLVIGGMDRTIANKNVCGAAKLHFYNQTRIPNVPFSFVKTFLEDNYTVFADVADICKKGGQVNTKNGAFMLAYYYALASGVPIETVTEFNKVVCLGFYEGEDKTAAIVLRNDILAGKLSAGGDRVNRLQLCFAVERAIYDFVHKKTRTRTYSSVDKGTYSVNEKFKADVRGYM